MLWAAAYDLKVFFTVVGKDPVEVKVADVLGSSGPNVAAAAAGVVRLADGGSTRAIIGGQESYRRPPCTSPDR
jgi:hypothetical protein